MAGDLRFIATGANPGSNNLTAPSQIEWMRNVQGLEMNVAKRDNAAPTEPASESITSKAIDFSNWNGIDDVNSNASMPDNRPKICALIGDFTSSPAEPGDFYSAISLTILARASEPAASRGQPIPDTTYTPQQTKLDVNYHPRPEASRPASYEAVVRGLAKVVARMRQDDKFLCCNFVIFENGQPTIDGFIRHNSG